MQQRTLQYADVVIHNPNMSELIIQLHPMETREQAIKRFARTYGSELTAITFFDRIQLKMGGLTFVSVEKVNLSRTIRLA